MRTASRIAIEFKQISFCLVGIALLLHPSTAFASTSHGGLISNIITVRQGRFFFSVSGPRDALPACATPHPDRWVIDLSTPGGQAIAAQVLSSYSLGKSVIVQGIGACADWPDTESIEFVQTLN